MVTVIPSKPFFNIRHDSQLKLRAYRVTLTSGKTEEFVSTSWSLALNAVAMQYPNDYPFSVDGKAVIGRCSRCRGWVLGGEKYRLEPGRVICEDC